MQLGQESEAKVFRAIARKADKVADVIEAGGNPARYLEQENVKASETLAAITKLQDVQTGLLPIPARKRIAKT